MRHTTQIMLQIPVECVRSPGSRVTCCSVSVMECAVMEAKAQLSQSWSVICWVYLSTYLLAPGAPLLKGGWGERLRSQPGLPQANRGVCVCPTWNSWFLDTQGVGIIEQCWGGCVCVCVYLGVPGKYDSFPASPASKTFRKFSPYSFYKSIRETQETWVWCLSQEDPLEEAMAIHSSILAWRIWWSEETVGYSPCGRKELDMTEHTRTPWGKPHMYRKVLGFPIVLHAQR